MCMFEKYNFDMLFIFKNVKIFNVKKNNLFFLIYLELIFNFYRYVEIFLKDLMGVFVFLNLIMLINI